MKAILLTGPNEFSVEEIPIPVPRNGEVLVKIESSPINPSDVVFLKGLYGTKKEFPVVPGFEGSGTVTLSGGGLLGWSLVGKRVAVSAEKGNGTWSEYTVVSAKSCVKLTPDIPFSLGCCMFCNPFTVVMFMEYIKNDKHKAVIQTGACSAIGKMLFRYCQHEGIPIINIVRRDEQVDILKNIGAEYVLNSNSEDFEENLKKLSVNLNASVAFDCVSGDMTGTLVNSMCENSVVYVYGSLSMEPIKGINPGAIIFSNKRVEGLWLSKWVKSKGLLALWSISNKVVSLLPTILKTEVSREFPLEEIKDALSFYKKNMTAGKVILKPSIKSLN